MKGYNFDFMPLYLDQWEQSNVIGSMPAAAEGLFLRLILKQWRNESIPADEERCRLLSRATTKEWKEFLPFFEEAFPVGDDGKRRNPQAGDRRRASICKIDQLRENGGKGGRPPGPSKPKVEPNKNQKEKQIETKEKPIGLQPGLEVGSESGLQVLSIKELSKDNSPKSPEGTDELFASFDDFFAKFKKVYPARSGGQNWPKASDRLKALWVAKGAEIIEGAAAYANERKRAGKVGTEFVKQASSWVTQRGWEDDYGLSVGSASPAAPRNPVSGIDFELKVVGESAIRVVPGTEIPFDEQAWRNAA